MAHPAVRRSALLVATLSLLALSWTGVDGGLGQLTQSKTSGQAIQTLTQFLYGFFSLCSVITAFKWRRLNTAMLAGWTISVTIAAGFAAVVWGGQSTTIGLASGAGALVIAQAINWLLRFGTRPPRA